MDDSVLSAGEGNEAFGVGVVEPFNILDLDGDRLVIGLVEGYACEELLCVASCESLV